MAPPSVNETNVPYKFDAPVTITGATGTAFRFVGATAGGAPASGQFNAGDVATDLTGAFWFCSTAGVPGTWVQIGSGVYLPLTGGGTVTGNLTVTTGAVDISTAGQGLKVAEGSNAKQGLATANSTTAVVVANTSVTANSRIFLSNQAGAGANIGALYVSATSVGTSFSFKSTGTADTSVVAYEIIEPG